jgi:hypothetical protein
MSGDIVNLRHARKAARRAEAEARAAENRAAFGLTRGERERLQADKDRAAQHLDRHQLTRTPPAKS